LFRLSDTWNQYLTPYVPYWLMRMLDSYSAPLLKRTQLTGDYGARGL